MQSNDFKSWHPWQRICKKAGVDLSFRFENHFDENRLTEELDAVLADFQPRTQHGKYHDGGWKAVSLVAANGDWREDRLLAGAEYAPTEVMDRTPYMREVIESIPGEKRRVRLMNLKAGKSIFWHYDRTDSADIHTARVHVPIITSPSVKFQICHEDHFWQPGEVWYGDFTFPHRLYNAGNADRIHLVLDIIRSPQLEALAPKGFRDQRELRRKIRRKAQSAFHRWSLLHGQGGARIHVAGMLKAWTGANEAAPA